MLLNPSTTDRFLVSQTSAKESCIFQVASEEAFGTGLMQRDTVFMWPPRSKQDGETHFPGCCSDTKMQEAVAAAGTMTTVMVSSVSVRSECTAPVWPPEWAPVCWSFTVEGPQHESKTKVKIQKRAEDKVVCLNPWIRGQTTTTSQVPFGKALKHLNVLRRSGWCEPVNRPPSINGITIRAVKKRLSGKCLQKNKTSRSLKKSCCYFRSRRLDVQRERRT